MIDTRIDRRGLLLGGAGLVLAGCGVGDSGSGSKEDTEKVVKAKVDGDLVYFNWSEYLDPELIKAFEKKYGVKVRQSNFDAMASMLAKLRSGNRYDMIFPDQSVTPRLVASNQLLQDRPRPAEELSTRSSSSSTTRSTTPTRPTRCPTGCTPPGSSGARTRSAA